MNGSKALEIMDLARDTEPEHPHLTDSGNARRLVEEFGDHIRYVYEHRQWHAWDGTCWAPDSLGAVERHAKRTVLRMYNEVAVIEDDKARENVRKWAVQSEAATRLDAMVKLARSDEKIVVRAVAFDTDPWSLNVANGIVDLRTGELRPHDPAEMHSKIAGASFDPEAGSERWERFMAEVIPDDEVRWFVQKLVGYSLTGEVGENVLPFPYGSGANGKSVFLGVLREVLGDYATEAAPDLLVAKRTPGIPVDVADLRGYRFVTTTEVEGGARMATDVMKRITGEQRLKARKMRQNFESFQNVTKLWMASNDRPQVDGLDEAIWRRVRLIPFTVTIPENRRDPFLSGKLLEERDGVLAWAVEGCLAWQREGLNPPPAVMAATTEYRDESNPLREWVEHECELDPEAVVAGSDLRDAYEKWCQVYRRRKIPNGTKWTAALASLGVHRPVDADDKGRISLDGRQVAAWEGIRLAERASGGLSIAG